MTLEIAYDLGRGYGSGFVDCYKSLNELKGKDSKAQRLTKYTFNHFACSVGRGTLDDRVEAN